MRPKRDRLHAFCARLTAAPRAATEREALALIEHTLNQVEDEFTPIPYDPERWASDGRMYAPRLDSARAVPNRPAVTRYRSRKHDVFIARNGAIRITEVGRAEPLLDLPGANGCLIDET